MTHERDPQADDDFVDHALQQELGGRRPPDFAARIAAAAPEQLAAAAARVDAAAAGTVRRARFRTALAAAAALLIGAVALWFGTHGTIRPQPSVVERAFHLLDDFHAAMPTHPVMLRDAARREEAATRALPVIRDILALHAANPGETVFGTRIFEFEVYATELGDGDLRRELQQRAAAGDVGAAAVLAVVRVATSDGDERAAALAELGAHLQQRHDLEASVVRALMTADLTPDEAERFAASMADPELRRVLLHEAELAANGPHRLLGQPLELFGRLLDDRLFSTSSLRGKVVLVCFWASWCQPCMQVLERIRRVQAQHPEVVVVGVSCDHETNALRDHLAAHPDLQWIQFFDRTRPGWHEFAIGNGIRVVPFVLLLDRDGTVRDVDVRGDLEAAVGRQLGR